MARLKETRKFGTHDRVVFSKIQSKFEEFSLPNLVEVQKKSYQTFIEKGLREVFDDFSPIEDYSKHFSLEFKEFSMDAQPKYSEAECRLRDATYASPLKINVRLTRKDTGETIDQEVFMGDFPKMTDTGSFIINGAERVVVSQIVRSPGIYCLVAPEKKSGVPQYNTQIIPMRGGWLEFEHDTDKEILYVHIDKNKKLPMTILLRAIGLSTDENILARLLDEQYLLEKHVAFWSAKENEEFVGALKSAVVDGLNQDNYQALCFNYAQLRLALRYFRSALGEGITTALAQVCNCDVQSVATLLDNLYENHKAELKSGDEWKEYVRNNKDKWKKEVRRDTATGESTQDKEARKEEEEFNFFVENEIADGSKQLRNAFLTSFGITLTNTLLKDTSSNQVEALIEIFKCLRPGEIPTDESVRRLLEDLLFDNKRYDIARVGRYKFNKKLSLALRIEGLELAEAVQGFKGKYEVGTYITEEIAYDIQHSGNNVVYVIAKDGTRVKVLGNNTVDINYYLGSDPDYQGIDFSLDEARPITEYVNLLALHSILDKDISVDEKIALIHENRDKLTPKHITREDIISTINYNLNLKHGIGSDDNIDHLANRRVRSVGELLQNQFRMGVARLERVIRERMAIQEPDKATPQSLINVRPVSSAIKEFFGSSQLSQFMDQSNPIAELTHKRKLSALGRGGLNRERATFQVRDVHYTHYGRMCPIETPEGQNIGLITSLTGYSRINDYGFIEAPYRVVDKATHTVTDKVVYLAADEEDKYTVAQADQPLDDDFHFAKDRVVCRRREETLECSPEEVDFMDVTPKQLVSVATSLIPFLENDDINRALMGSNMQRQAVPLLKPQAPIVATGIEERIAYDSGVMVTSKTDGVVTKAASDKIVVKDNEGKEHEYTLKKFVRSNQNTCINQRTLAKIGDQVKVGDVLADGHSTDGGELALGRNILIGFTTWEGYNYEDAILISEELVKDDVFTSIHIEEHEIECRETKLGPEIFTREIPNVSEDMLKDLDENGIIRIGAEVRPGDILVGKLTPKGEAELTPEEKLLRAIFSEKAAETRDTSLRVLNGEAGIVVDVKVFTRENKDELPADVTKLVRVYIAQKRKLSVGDKMAGRHGNKGVVSRILPVADMPFMADGTPLQIVLNPLGVPSRMNIGQVLEVHLGLVAKMLGWKVCTPVFDGATEQDIKQLFNEMGMVNPETGKVDGKVQLFDGRTGEPFENRVTVGYMYMLKLVHLVDDKIHARSIGPYSLVTQQPLGGKAQMGGQRFGEMEVWALEAYGAANVLQEVLTIKSDDMVGRVKTYEAIVNGDNIADPGVPEAFKVLVKELQALALDIKVLSQDGEEIVIRDATDDEADYNETVLQEAEQKKEAMHSFVDNDELDLENINTADIDTADADDIFSVDNLFDSKEDEEEQSLFDLGDLFGDVSEDEE